MIEELDGFLHPLLWNCGDMRDSLVGLMEELRRGRDGHLGRHLRYLEGLRGRFRGFWRVKRQEGKRGRGWRRRCREFEGQIRRLEELVRGQLGDGKGMEAEKQAVTIQGLGIAGFGYDSDNSDMELELTDRDSIHSSTQSTDNWEHESEPLVREQQSESKPAINDALLIDDIDTESHYSNDELELTDHESLYYDTEPWEREPLICPPSPLRLQKGPSSSSPRTAGGPLRIHLTRHTNSGAPKIPRSGDGEMREVTPTADIDILLNDIVLDAAETAEGIDDERIHIQDKIHHLNPLLSPTPIPKTNFPASISIPAATSDSGESSVRRRRNVNALPSPMHQSTKGLPLAPKVRRIDIGVLGANTITWADNTSPDAKATSPAAPTVGKVISIRTRRERRRGGGREWVAGVEQDAEGMGDDGGLGEATGTVEDGDNAQVANRITQTDTTDLEAHEKGEEGDTARLTLLPMSSGINSSNHRDAETRIDQVDVSIPAESQKLNPDMDQDMDMINFAANTGVCMEFMEIKCIEPEPLDPDAMEPKHSNNKKISRLTMLMTKLLDKDRFTARDGVWIDNLNPDIDAEGADEEDDELVTAPSSPVLPINITTRGSKGTTLPDRLTSKESGTGEVDALIHPTPENADETNVSRLTSVNLRTYNRDSMLDLSALSVPRNTESMNIGFQGERVTWPGYGNPAVKGNAQDSIRGRRMSCQTSIGSQHCPAPIAILLKNIDTPMETEDISTDISDADTARTSQRSVTIPHSSSSTTSKMEPAVDVDVLSTSSEKRSSCVDLDVGKLSPEGLTEGLGISVPVPASKKQKTVLANIDVVAANRNICVRKALSGTIGAWY
ncbi:hypothetical protein FPQ18DRAFT_397326 [Pyronema domesticum]|nr:hypothetical protein FPQ18DRAFT_397326 [Pyronema domesticum]